MFNQFNVEKKWYTYTDKILSVSGELLIDNNVDISGNLNVNEKLTINNNGAIGIGGTNYGISGQVLTSNGSGSVVSWSSITTTPAYCHATQTGGAHGPLSTSGFFTVPYNTVNVNVGSIFNNTTNQIEITSADYAGYYVIHASPGLHLGNRDGIYVETYITKTSSGVDTRLTMYIYESHDTHSNIDPNEEGSRDDFNYISCPMSCITQLNNGDSVRVEARVSTLSGAASTYLIPVGSFSAHKL